MIVKVNPLVLESQDVKMVLEMLQILLNYIGDRFLWDQDNLQDLFIDEDGQITISSSFEEKALTPLLKQELFKKIEEALMSGTYNTALHEKYLSTVTIGFNIGEIHPQEAFNLINSWSYLVVENATYDGRFINGLINNYENYGTRKSIYQLIKKAWDKHYLRALHAGGGGSIEAQLELYGNLAEYNGIIEQKTLTIFDSDRDDSGAINTKYRNLLEFLKGRKFDILDQKEWVHQKQDRFLWHMWYKRELENYVPLALLFEACPEIDEKMQNQLRESNEETQDFFKFGTILAKGYKSITPDLFLKNGITGLLEAKCAHHKVKVEIPNGTLTDVTEIEKVLLMIAQII